MLSVKNITFGYDKKNIFQGLSFQFPTEDRGKFISIIGPNGCGKTTLLNLLTGEFSPVKGEILYDDKNIKDFSVKELAKFFAVTRQRSNISFPFSCLDIVLMGRNPYKEKLSKSSDEDLEIVSDVMKKTDTYKFIPSLITEISGGEYQRVMLARALSQTPEILFLDEAFSAMDIAYKVKLLKLLKEIIKEKKITVISIMHDLNLAFKFSDKVCVMSQGNILSYGIPQDVLNEELIKSVFDIDVEMVKNKGFLIT